MAFANDHWAAVAPDWETIKGAPFSSLFRDADVGENARSMVEKVLQERKNQVLEGVLEIGDVRIWTRMNLRSIRIGSERMVLVPVEDLTLEKKQLAMQKVYGEKLREAHDELERRVQERTAQLVAKNKQLHEEIAEREKIEKSLRASEERFRAVLESAEDWVFVKDSDLRYTHINPALLKLWGLQRSEVVGRTDGELFGFGEQERTEEVEARVLGGQTIDLERTMKFADQEIVCNFVRVPLRDASGRISGLCGIGRDITERTKRKEALESDDVESERDQYLSEAMKRTVEQVRQAARGDSICLFLGESGTGKDFLARQLHEQSERAGGPLFTINCAALPPELAESELFGHEAGAFTGAAGRKRGLIELAEGGTLLLNEVGDLSLPLQAKLLTFLDTKSFTRVGGERTVKVNVRVVAATNRDLEKEVAAGRFRTDLFYRLNVIAIRVPPLSERIADISLLVQRLIRQMAKRMGLREVPEVDKEAMEALAAYDWPGNVRELRNVLERSLILRDGPRITASQIGLNPGDRLADSEPGISFTVHLPEGASMHEALRDVKRMLVTEGLRRSDGSIKDAANILGISRDSFNHHMRSLGVRE